MYMAMRRLDLVSPGTSKAGFSLIELLTVISVISLLMGIMLPVLAKARSAGRRIVCLSNMRQLVLAADSYANNFDGFYPIAYNGDPNPADSTAIESQWDFTRIKDLNTGETRIEAGTLWQGETIIKIQQCPAFKDTSNSTDPYTGYNYNTSYIGHGIMEWIKIPARRIDVRKPSQCALFGDGEQISGPNKFMRSPFPDSYDFFTFRAAGAQGFRHDGKTNVAWCDGHASSQRQVYTESTSSQSTLLESYNETANIKIGFLSPDNSAYDLQ